MGALDRFRVRARQLRTRQTNAESILWYALRNRRLARWKFRRQHPIDRFVVDFVTVDGTLIVEVDGATHSLPSEVKRDEERDRILDSLGFRVLRVGNVSVYENLDGVIETILAELGSLQLRRSFTSPRRGEVGPQGRVRGNRRNGCPESLFQSLFSRTVAVPTIVYAP